MAKKTVESRAEGYKQAWGRYLELVDEAEGEGEARQDAGEHGHGRIRRCAWGRNP